MKIDWLTAVLVSLVIAIHTGALLLVGHFETPLSMPETQSSDLSIGPKLAAGLVLYSLLLVGVWRLWSRTSPLLKKIAIYGLVVAFLGSVAAIAYTVAGFIGLVAAGVSFLAPYALLKLMAHFDVHWVAFNAVAVCLGIAVTAMGGAALSPAVVISVLVLVLLWDHVAVNLSGIMSDLVDFSASAGLPNFLVVPAGLQLDLSDVQDYINGDADEKPENVACLIGVGDFAFPGFLTVSAWVAGGPVPAIGALIGTAVAMVVLRDSMAGSDGGLPALPWLNTGALIGFAVGVALAGVSVSTALGVSL